jgi:LacI family transcriptional regulator
MRALLPKNHRISKRTVTLADIARTVGVSRAVVGRVLLGSGEGVIRVAKETEEQIRHVAQAKGYHPNRPAQQLAGGRSHAIGVIVAAQVPDITVLRLAAIEREAAKVGLRVIIGRFDQANPALINDYLDDFSGRNIDGLIIIDHYLWSRQTVAEVVTKLGRTPVVFQSQGELPPGVARVRLDLGSGANAAVDHLVTRGHQRIGLAINGGQLPSYLAREHGFALACCTHRLASRPSWIWTPPIVRQQLTAPDLDSLIRKLVVEQRVTAVVTENDYWAMHLISALERQGKRVPAEVAVIGYNNLAFAAITRPALTTLDENNQAVAGQLLRLLNERIQLRRTGRPTKMAEEVSVHPELVVRESA